MSKYDSFFSYRDSALEKIFLIEFPNASFPDKYEVDKLEINVLDFLEKNFSLMIVRINGTTENNEQQIPPDQELHELHELRELFNERTDTVTPLANSFRYYINRQIPILIKVSFNDNDHKLDATIVSTDRKYLMNLYETLSKYKSSDNNSVCKFGILYEDTYGLSIQKIPLNDKYLNNLNLELIELNYGNDFLTDYNIIYNKLINNKNNLFLFHSTAGCGKTTFIKYLAKNIKSKLFIFIPTQYIDSLVSPKLLPVLLRYKNSVLVLEDAEKALISRERGEGNEALVSTLLNLSDGIMGSMLNISIIVTFNTGKEIIDPALLRKGRLSYEYEFKPLSIENSQKLIDKLGKNYKVTEPMTLADIYNIEDITGHKQEENTERIIGFGK